MNQNVEVSNHRVTNNQSVISLTLGILSIVLPIIGLILGVIGIVYARKATKEISFTNENENGSGLATAGMICSIVGIIIQGFGVLGMIAFNMMTVA